MQLTDSKYNHSKLIKSRQTLIQKGKIHQKQTKLNTVESLISISQDWIPLALVSQQPSTITFSSFYHWSMEKQSLLNLFLNNLICFSLRGCANACNGLIFKWKELIKIKKGILLEIFNFDVNFCFDVNNLFIVFSPLNLYAQFDLLKEILRVACDIPGVKVVDPTELCGIMCVYVCVCAHTHRFRSLWLFVIPWTFPCSLQDSCVHGIFQGRILE